jgi:hypothetical protein
VKTETTSARIRFQALYAFSSHSLGGSIGSFFMPITHLATTLNQTVIGLQLNHASCGYLTLLTLTVSFDHRGIVTPK